MRLKCFLAYVLPLVLAIGLLALVFFWLLPGDFPFEVQGG